MNSGRHGGSSPGWSCPRGGSGRGRLRRSLMETALLVSLARGAAHGYQLIQEMQDLLGGQVAIDPGSVYRVLRSLEEEGRVISEWKNQASGPSRRIYRLTEAGRATLKEWALFLEQRAQTLSSLARLANEALGCVVREDSEGG